MKTPNQQDNLIVSIIIPSFNQGEFIEETICSVLSQTYRPLEVIVIDGASTDNTVDILRKYDKQITWVSEPDEGQADAVNKGFELAQGDIIGWLNSDDVYFTKTSVESMVQAFHTYPEADIIYGEVAVISKKSILIRFGLVPPYSSKFMKYGCFICQPSAFFRRYVVDTEKLYTGFILPDREYWARLDKKGYTFQHIQTLIAGDRHYSNRTSVFRHKEMTEANIKLQSMYGIAGVKSKRFSPMFYFIRFRQIPCRLRGLLLVIAIFFDKHYQEKLAFPVKIDSPWKLFFRQLLKNRSVIMKGD